MVPDDDDEDFQQHQITTKWQEQCPSCRRTFTRPGVLTSHMKNHCMTMKQGFATRIDKARSQSSKRVRDADNVEGNPRKKRWYEMDDDLDIDCYGGKTATGSKVSITNKYLPPS